LVIDPNNWILNKVGTITKGTDLFLGVAINDINQINLYPNPATNVVNINSSKKFVTYKISNLLGQEIIKQSSFNSSEINISSLSVGVYSLQLQDEQGVFYNLKLEKK
jgi:hypothetical protein